MRQRLEKPRPALRLSLEEREVISRGLSARWTLSQIAAELGRSVSTVSRQVCRNSGVDGYRAVRADRLTVARTARPRLRQARRERSSPSPCRGQVGAVLVAAANLAPARRGFPTDEMMRVSHETIYTSLFAQTRPGLKPDLSGKLRTKRVRRHSKRHVAFSAKWSRIADLVSVSGRPVEATAKHPAIGKAT